MMESEQLDVVLAAAIVGNARVHYYLLIFYAFNSQ